MTVSEIRSEMRAIRKEMKEKRVRVVSCFNAGLSPDEYWYNSQLFAMKSKLYDAVKAEAK